MLPQRIELNNFIAYSKCIVDMSHLHVVALCGDNGSGKSTLLDSITYALFGQARSDSADELVRLGTEDMSVTLDFLLNGQEYRVVRSRTTKGRGKTMADLQCRTGEGWTSLVPDKSIKDVNTAIESLIKLDYNTFISTAFVLQDKANAFTSKTPGERKAVLGKILNLDMYSDAQNRANERAKKLALQVAEKKALKESLLKDVSTLPLVKARLSETDELISSLTCDIVAKEAELEILRNDLASLGASEQQRDSLRAQLKTLDITGLKNEREGAAARIRSLEAMVDLLPGLRKAKEERDSLDVSSALERRAQYTAVVEKRNSLKAQFEKWNNEKTHSLVRIDDTIATAKTDIELIKSSGCDSATNGAQCRFLQRAHKAQEQLAVLMSQREEVMSRQADALTEQLMDIDMELDMMEYDPAEVNRVVAKARELDAELHKLPQAERAEAQAEELRSRIEAIALEVARREIEAERVSKELKTLEIATTAIPSKRAAVLEAERQLGALRNDITSKQQNIGALKERITTIEENSKKADSILPELIALSRQQVTASTLQGILGRNGVQALIIDNVCPELEALANDLLGRMTQGSMQVAIRTQKETKSDTMAETLDIIISDALGKRAYEMYSGAEKFKVNIAIRIALSKLLAHRSGAKVETLVIDEGFGSLDQAGLLHVTEAINVISTDFKLVLCITHLPELKAAFPSEIYVTKSDAGSTVDVRR